MNGLLIAAPASGHGKTMVTLGLLRAFAKRGVSVCSAKSGPDYIDPGHHRLASGRDCVTLDPFAMSVPQLRARAMEAGSAEMLIVEGAMGLFDGAAGGHDPCAGQGSSGATAMALGLPVLLVVDCARAGQTVGALVSGLAHWHEGVRIAGVVLNRIASARHEAMVRPAVERVCPVLGVLPRASALTVPSRHLGLMQAAELDAAEAFVEGAAEVVARSCDLDAIRALAAPVIPGEAPRRLPVPGQRIAVACDAAFSFTYPHMLSDWRDAGAEISTFSPLADEGPDTAADTVFLPGGYPELHAGRLAGAETFHRGMRAARDRGAVIYGECGGYMVLGRGLVDAEGGHHRMLGFLGLETSFAERSLHLGYRRLSGAEGPFSGAFAAHEFHYTRTLLAEGAPLFQAEDAQGTALEPMGLRHGHVMGSFAHIIDRMG